MCKSCHHGDRQGEEKFCVQPWKNESLIIFCEKTYQGTPKGQEELIGHDLCELTFSRAALIGSDTSHDYVMKWKHFPRYWPFVLRIHRFPVNSPHKGHWRGALMFSLICVWINGWVNNREAGNMRRHRAHYDIIVMWGNHVGHLDHVIWSEMFI